MSRRGDGTKPPGQYHTDHDGADENSLARYALGGFGRPPGGRISWRLPNQGGRADNGCAEQEP